MGFGAEFKISDNQRDQQENIKLLFLPQIPQIFAESNFHISSLVSQIL